MKRTNMGRICLFLNIKHHIPVLFFFFNIAPLRIKLVSRRLTGRNLEPEPPCKHSGKEKPPFNRSLARILLHGSSYTDIYIPRSSGASVRQHVHGSLDNFPPSSRLVVQLEL